jgi:hypothetical protein
MKMCMGKRLKIKVSVSEYLAESGVFMTLDRDPGFDLDHHPYKIRTKPVHFFKCHFSEALFGKTRPKPDRFQTEKGGGPVCFVSIRVDSCRFVSIRVDSCRFVLGFHATE